MIGLHDPARPAVDGTQRLTSAFLIVYLTYNDSVTVKLIPPVLSSGPYHRAVLPDSATVLVVWGLAALSFIQIGVLCCYCP
jgi:hypothetical protein